MAVQQKEKRTRIATLLEHRAIPGKAAGAGLAQHLGEVGRGQPCKQGKMRDHRRVHCGHGLPLRC
jgi:hypothetical protein